MKSPPVLNRTRSADSTPTCRGQILAPVTATRGRPEREGGCPCWRIDAGVGQSDSLETSHRGLSARESSLGDSAEGQGLERNESTVFCVDEVL